MRSLAVVHPTSLLGKELRERLEARPDLCRELRLMSLDANEIGTVTEAVGAATFVNRLDAEALDGVDLVFLCGDIASDRRALAELPAELPAVLLSRGATADDAPMAVAGVRPDALVGLDRVTSPHPAAVALALLLEPLAGVGLRAASATVTLPVSVFGDPGIDELFEETRGILAFSGKPKSRIFQAQIAFNLLPSAEDAEAIARSARQAIGLERLPLALQLLQTGVFHGLGISLHVELAAQSSAADLRKLLGRSAGISIVRDARKLGPVACAGEETLQLGEVRAGGTEGAYWLWAAMDNLVRGGALNAIDLAAALLAAGRPS